MSPEPNTPTARLSIGELARLAGITPRAVRHYHSTGLLPEPVRDSSGYRRYGAQDVIAIVRIARLRSLGVPISQIRSQMIAGADEISLAAALAALADDVDREISRLVQTRDRLRELSATQALERPLESVEQELRTRGLLPVADQLDPREQSAVDLLDALHPGGIAGVLDQADQLFADPATVAELGKLALQVRMLTEESDVDALASAVVALLPRPADGAPPVDVDLMDKLLGNSLTDVQRRFMRRLREKFDNDQ